MNNAPLAGVRVLDLTRLVPGPLGSLVLADMGAQVDKVEDPNGGDYLRHMPPQLGDQNTAFLALNRGKRSIVLDLKRPEGRATFERILPRYDVLFEQFRPGVLDRLGLGHATLRAKFPRLVIAALTGYGRHGDRRATLETGFDAHLTKPVGVEQLQAVLKQVPVLGDG